MARRKMKPQNLRSRQWFDNPENPGMTAIYLERTVNWGLTVEELRSGRPIIGIARRDGLRHLALQPPPHRARPAREGRHPRCRRHPLEFPVHQIQETLKRPTAAPLDRNLQYLSLVEILYGYPMDGVVLMSGCDKTMPALVMGAATVNIPRDVLSGGPMLNGWWNGKRAGSGTSSGGGPQAPGRRHHHL